MKISVAVPCFNGARHVGPVIESILGQSRPADQVLVVDDGSTDGTVAIVRQFPVTLIRHSQNCGLAVARNTAIQAADGDVLAFIDADAYADNHWLACLLAGYTSDRVGGVGGAAIEANIRTVVDQWRQLHASQHHGWSHREKVDFLYGLNMSFRLAALRHVGGFSPEYRTNAEDMDLGFRITDAGYQLAYNPDARVYHQRTDDRRSIRRTIHNWYFWAFVAKRNNHRNPWSLAAGTARRLLWADTWRDLVCRRSLSLARLDVEMAMVKISAILAAARSKP